MLKRILGFLLPFLLCGNLHAADEFEAVKCGSDIAKALIGKRMSNEPVVKTEARHKDLALKDLGADEINDNMNTINWLICGNEYVILESKEIVRDVLLLPPHSKSAPAFDSICERNGIQMKEVVVGVLKDEPGAQTLQAQQAWKIDEKNAKFVKIATDGLRCPRSGIFTEDRGK